MKHLLHTTLLVMFLPAMVLGQSMEYFKFSIDVSYLPSCERTYEEHSIQIGGHLKHFVTRTSCKKTIKRKLKRNTKIEDVIKVLDSLLRLRDYTFTIDASLIDSLKVRSGQKKNYGITDQDIDSFFNRHDTISLSPLSLRPKPLPGFSSTFGAEGSINDGSPFTIELYLKRSGEDTIKYQGHGNFGDDVYIVNMRFWLSMYLAQRQYKLFNSVVGTKYYFGDRKFEDVLFKFIAWS